MMVRKMTRKTAAICAGSALAAVGLVFAGAWAENRAARFLMSRSGKDDADELPQDPVSR